MNANEEANWTSELAVGESSISQLSNQISTLSVSTSDVAKRLERLNKQCAQREDLLAERQAVKEEREEVSKQLETHSTREEELMKMLAQAEKELELNEKELELVKKKDRDVDDLRVSGEKEEAEVLEPARHELPELLEEGEVLAREIAARQEKLCSLKQSCELDVASRQAISNDVVTQVVAKCRNVKEKNERLEKLQGLRDELNKSARDEVDQHGNLKAKFDEASKAQAAVIEALEEQREKERSERDETKKLEFIAETVKLEKLTCGVEVIKETKRLESKLGLRVPYIAIE